MEAELHIPAAAMGKIREGLKVRLRYRAYPDRRYGSARGVISSISRIGAASSHEEAEGPIYRATISLIDGGQPSKGGALPLWPDMPLTAEIVTDRRTLADRLFRPTATGHRR